jgi:hypothetical protein
MVSMKLYAFRIRSIVIRLFGLQINKFDNCPVDHYYLIAISKMHGE